jgi:hypothetical protein
MERGIPRARRKTNTEVTEDREGHREERVEGKKECRRRSVLQNVFSEVVGQPSAEVTKEIEVHREERKLGRKQTIESPMCSIPCCSPYIDLPSVTL